MRKLLLISLIVITLLSTACSNPKQKNDPNQLQVYTTVYPLTYFTEQIGRQFVHVTSTYPPGGDEHTFEPTQKDMINVADADLFFYIGYNLEGFVSKMKTTLKKEKVTIVAIGEKVHLEASSEHETDDDGHNHENVNPHLWLDPIYCIDMAEAIKDSLSKQLPAQKDFFEENFQKLKQQLMDLDHEYSQATSSATKKQFLVSHAAFSYWAERYHIQQLSVMGMSTANEPSQKQLTELIELAKQYGIHYILLEQNVSSKIPETIKTAIHGETLPIHNLAVLTEIDIQNHEDYFSLARKNLDSLRTALNH